MGTTRRSSACAIQGWTTGFWRVERWWSGDALGDPFHAADLRAVGPIALLIGFTDAGRGGTGRKVRGPRAPRWRWLRGRVQGARHVHLGTLHGLKILRPEHVGNEQIRLRFLDEARVQAQLVHPNIARVTDIIVTQGIAGLVMEYLEGRSLADFIDVLGGPASEEEILAIMLPVLEALHFSHERGVVHRDVKPDNIFLAVDEAGQQVPKVLDFGIAKVRGELREKGKRKSTVATAMGTEGYAAPEQLRNAADVDRRADIFSVGVTLFELATGRLPFERDSDVDSLIALMAGAYSIPAQLRQRSALVAEVIDMALQSDRENRFSEVPAMTRMLTSRGGSIGTAALQFERRRLLNLLDQHRLGLSARSEVPHRSNPGHRSLEADLVEGWMVERAIRRVAWGANPGHRSQEPDPVEKWVVEREIKRVAWGAALFILVFGAISSAANC